MREIPYGFETRIFSRSRGESAVAKAAYRAGARLVDQRTGEIHDYTAKQDVEHREILAPAGAAEWVFDREQLWNRVESAEARKDAQVARDIRLTLPRELSREQQIELVREHIESEYVSRGMVADFAIHSPPASDGGEQPHAHIMLTMRRLDTSQQSGFARTKAREWNADFSSESAFKTAHRGDKPGRAFVAETAGLEGMRARWAELENRHLAAAGIDARVDHRSLAAQRADAIARGDLDAAARLDRPAEPKLRPGEGKRGKQSERTATVRDLRQHRAEIIDLAAERRRRQRRHPDDIRAEAERPTGAQLQQMGEANERIDRARQRLAGRPVGASGPDHDGGSRPDLGADGAPRAAGRQPQQNRPGAGTAAAASGPAGRPGGRGDGAPGRARRDQSPEAIARRRERARRISEARARQATLDSGNQVAKDRYKLKLLEQQYGQDMPPEIAGNLAWVRARQASGEVAVQMRDGGRMRDDGAALRARGEGGSTIAVMVAAARSHGWTEIDVSRGSKAFRERSAEALTRAGIAVKNSDLAGVVERTKAAMAAEAIAAERQFVRDRLAEVEQQLATSQRIAQDYEWTGPDGRRRPLREAMVVRDHLQPSWEFARAAPADLRAELRERQAEYAKLSLLERGFGGRAADLRDEIERLKSALPQAERRAAAVERQWSAMAGQAAQLLRQAEKMRDAAEAARDTAAQNAATHSRRAGELRDLGRWLDAMAEAGELRPSPPGLDRAQRLDWLKQQADDWGQRQQGDGPRMSSGPSVRR